MTSSQDGPGQQPVDAGLGVPLQPNAVSANYTANFAQQVQAQVQQSADLKAAATSGKFSINPEAAQEMIKAYQFAQQEWLDGQREVDLVAEKYQLGSTPGAKVISNWNQQVGQQFAMAYMSLRDVYQNQIDAYTQAMKNYQENEAKVSDSLRKAGES
ncbi:MAG TPA: hypothetical protein VF444_24605 [Pseudonocardiaceae bacterium]